MRTGQLRVAGAVALSGVLAAVGIAVAAEGGADTVAVAADDGAIVAELLRLEVEVPEQLPTAATLVEADADVSLAGSFASTRSEFDRIEADLRALYVASDSAQTAVGDAIALVTSGLLEERQGLLVLEAVDTVADARPIDASDARDDAGVAIDADGLAGQTQLGISILLDARAQQLDGYAVLRDLDAELDPSEVFDGRYLELQEYGDTVGSTLRLAAGERSAQLLVPSTRFEAPVGVAPAVSVTYVCVDRDDYLALADLPAEERIAGSLEVEPDEECAEAARRASQPVTTLESSVTTTGAGVVDGAAGTAGGSDG